MFTQQNPSAESNTTTPDDTKQRQRPTSYLTQMAAQLRNQLIDPYFNLDDDPKTVSGLSRTCHAFHSFYQPHLKNIRLQRLLTAIIDDKRSDVKKIVEAEPTLLLKTPDAKMVIQSQYTWQRFYAENALTMAVKRKQVEMVRILLPYFDQLPQTDNTIQLITDALSHDHEYKLDDEKKPIIPHEYTAYLQILIDQFITETFPNGVHMRATLTDETEARLQQFRDIVLPAYPVALDDYFDPDLFLYASLKAIHDNASRFVNQHQQEHFLVKIIGFIQGLLTPESAAIWCDGMYNFAKENKPISDRAARLQMWGGAPFYRSKQSVRADLGYEYFCSGVSTIAPGFVIRTNVRHHEWGDILRAKSAALKSTIQVLTQHDEISNTSPLTR